ncbi:MAG: SDR family oxidoreductase [Verrucomicrobiia bacterium]
MKILVTGATGYVGGRLVPRLLESGHSVRVVVRDIGRVRGRVWLDKVEVCEGDLRDASLCRIALEGVQCSFFLVHAMSDQGDFEQEELHMAATFAKAAREARCRIIYLGGLQPRQTSRPVSRHLRSRAEVGRILAGETETMEFRAGPIVGSGSASFEMVRYLTERLPVMVAPRWILNLVQPIAIRDVLAYLVAAVDRSETGIVEIGAEPLSFRAMMLEYAAERDLKRIILPLPLFAPTLAARWIGLVTPIPNRLAIPLVQGIAHSLLGDTRRAAELFPEVRPVAYSEAVRLALQKIREGFVETRWSGALADGNHFELQDWEGLIQEVRRTSVAAAPESVFRAFCGLGGERGWLVWGWAWRLRGWLDKLLGGPGLRRGRRHPDVLLPGEAVDFWRVEAVEPNSLLRLRAEMKVPGKAWLQYEVEPCEKGSRLIQTALFAPNGFWGALYWYGLYPIHRLIFSDLARAVARLAERTPPQ